MKTTENPSVNANRILAEKYEQFKLSVLALNLEAFDILEDIRSKEKAFKGIGITLDGTKTVDEIFSAEEKLALYKRVWEKNVYNPTRSGVIHISSIHGDNRSFLSQLHITATAEMAGEVFCAMSEGWHSHDYEFSMSELGWREYLPISKKVAVELLRQKNKFFWNNEELEYAKIKKVISSAKRVHLYSQHSYYGFVRLGDKEKEKGEK